MCLHDRILWDEKKSSQEYAKDVLKAIEEGRLEGEIPYSPKNNDIPKNCDTRSSIINQFREHHGLEKLITPKQAAGKMAKDITNYGALLEEYDREVIQPIINTIESYK